MGILLVALLTVTLSGSLKVRHVTTDSPYRNTYQTVYGDVAYSKIVHLRSLRGSLSTDPI